MPSTSKPGLKPVESQEQTVIVKTTSPKEIGEEGDEKQKSE